MDVKEIKGANLSGMAGAKGKKEEMEGLDFQKLLQEAQSNRKPAEGATSPTTAPGQADFFADSVLALPSLNLVPQPVEAPVLRARGIEATEKAMDLLEKYQRAMADPEISLKEVDPLVQSLSRELKGLAGWAEQLPASDPLQKIMTDLRILSSVEVEKFNRGDYI